MSRTNVYGVVLFADSDYLGLSIEIRLKTDKPVTFKIAGFLSDMVLVVKNEFYTPKLIHSESLS